MDLEFLKGMLRSGRDVAGTIGSSLLAEPVAGLGGLARLATTGDTAKAAATIEALRDKLTYQPDDMRAMENIAAPFKWAEENVIKPASDAAYEVGGPVAGSAMYTALNMADPFKGKGKVKPRVPQWQRDGLPPPKGWYKPELDTKVQEMAERVEALRVEGKLKDVPPPMFEPKPLKIAGLPVERLDDFAEHIDDFDERMFDGDPDAWNGDTSLLAPLDDAAHPRQSMSDVEWGGPPEGGLFNFNDPMHFEFLAEQVDPTGTMPQAQLDIAVRHEMARMNATAPAEIGGLGLRADNTPMQRAAAQNYEDDLYHGSMSGSIESFDPARDRGANYGGQGTYMTSNPADASKNYADFFGIDIAGKAQEALPRLADEMDYDPRLRDRITPAELQQVSDAVDARLMGPEDAGPMYGLTPETAERFTRAAGLGDSLGAVYPLMLRKGKTLDSTDLSPHVTPEAAHEYMQDLSQSRAFHAKRPDDPVSKYVLSDTKVSDADVINLLGEVNMNPHDVFRNFELQDDFNTLVHRPDFGFSTETPTDRHYIAREPKQIRSKFAAFDPAQKNSPNILALKGGSTDPRQLLKQKLRETAINSLQDDEDQQGK